MGFLPDKYNPVKIYEGLKQQYGGPSGVAFNPLMPFGLDVPKMAGELGQRFTEGSLAGSRFDIPAQVRSLFGGSSRTAQAQTADQPYGAPTQDMGQADQVAQDYQPYQYGTETGDLYGGTGETSEGANRLNEQFMATLQEYEDRANRTADELIARAEGDRDFAIRQLDAEHKVALGQNDQERAKFLEQVANKLEERIGTIPYDYKVGVTRLEETKATALERLARDEQELRRKLGIETEQARQTQGETLSQRGLLTGPRDETVGLGAGEVRRLEDEIEAKFQAIERGSTEGREDITRTATRGVEDVTTKQRRLAALTGRTYEFGKEEAQRDLEAERQRVERQKALAKLDIQAMQFQGAK